MEENLKTGLKTLDDVEVKTAEGEAKPNAKLEAKPEVKAEESAVVIKTDPLEEYRSADAKHSPEVKNFRQFVKAIVYNRPELVPASMKGNFLNETTGGDGGYLVPDEFLKKIYENIALGGVARRNCSVVKMSKRLLKLPTLSGLPAFTFQDEGGQKSVSNPTFSQVILQRRDGGFIIVFSKQLLEDEEFDLLTFVANMSAKVIIINEDTAAFRGLSPIVGLLGASGATPVTTSGPAFSSLLYDNLIDATAAVPSHTLPNAKWYLHRTIWGVIKKMKYAGSEEYILSADDKKNMMMEGYPVQLTDGCYAMTESAASRAFIGFGDLSYLVLGERQSLTLDYSKEATIKISDESTLNLWQQGLIGLNIGVSFDMKFTFPEALAVVKTAAS